MSIEQTRQIVSGDLDPDFVEAASKEVAWEYDELYEVLASDSSLTDPVREEQFSRRRGERIAHALARVAKRCGIPYEFRKLECNGQHKLLIKAGRVLLIQEPIIMRSDHPNVSEYKRSLADIHGFVRQLELDLGDQPQRIRDWSGCVLVVLLHGPRGPRFNRSDKALGAVMFGVPDAAYQQWIMRIDLQDTALFGRSREDRSAANKSTVQTDNVIVTPKKKNTVVGSNRQ